MTDEPPGPPGPSPGGVAGGCLLVVFTVFCGILIAIEDAVDPTGVVVATSVLLLVAMVLLLGGWGRIARGFGVGILAGIGACLLLAGTCYALVQSSGV